MQTHTAVAHQQRRLVRTSTYDYRVSFTRRELESGQLPYNFTAAPVPEGFTETELPGLSAFFSDQAGDIFHTYSSYGARPEELIGTLMILDRAPWAGTRAPRWTLSRRHDEYQETPSAAADRLSEVLACHEASWPPPDVRSPQFGGTRSESSPRVSTSWRIPVRSAHPVARVSLCHGAPARRGRGAERGTRSGNVRVSRTVKPASRASRMIRIRPRIC